MRFPNKEIVEQLRREFPIGTRVELMKMDDVQAPPIGTMGTVKVSESHYSRNGNA